MWTDVCFSSCDDTNVEKQDSLTVFLFRVLKDVTVAMQRRTVSLFNKLGVTVVVHPEGHHLLCDTLYLVQSQQHFWGSCCLRHWDTVTMDVIISFELMLPIHQNSRRHKQKPVLFKLVATRTTDVRMYVYVCMYVCVCVCVHLGLSVWFRFAQLFLTVRKTVSLTILSPSQHCLPHNTVSLTILSSSHSLHLYITTDVL